MTIFAFRLFAITLAMLTFAHGVTAQSVNRTGQHAVTMWWVIFNEPANCNTNPGGAVKCGSADVFGADFLESVANGSPDPALIAPNMNAGPGVLFATGGVTSKSGRIQLVSSLYLNANDEPLALPGGSDPMGFGRGFDSQGAEIHLVVRDHGRPNYRDLIPQITNFLDPYCSDPNLLYFAGDNICSDVHFAVFGPGESGGKDVYAFANPGEALRGATASLYRDGDVIRAVLDTRLQPAN